MHDGVPIVRVLVVGLPQCGFSTGKFRFFARKLCEQLNRLLDLFLLEEIIGLCHFRFRRWIVGGQRITGRTEKHDPNKKRDK